MRLPVLAAPVLIALAAFTVSCSGTTAPSTPAPGTATLTLTGALSAHASGLPAHAFYRTQVNIGWPVDSTSSRPQPTQVVILLVPQELNADSVPQTVHFLNDGGQSVRVTAIGQGISPIFWSTSGSVTFTSLTGNEMAGHIDAVLDAGAPTHQTVHLTGQFTAE